MTAGGRGAVGPCGALAALALLAACGTPQQQCIARETRDLRTLDALIAETSGNLDRGYAMVEYRRMELVPYPCWRPVGRGGEAVATTCWHHEPAWDSRPQAINLDTERAKLSTMKVKRRELAARAARAVEACRRAYPE